MKRVFFALLLSLLPTAFSHATYFDAETGLLYSHHRYYDPRTGRYLQPDPVSIAEKVVRHSVMQRGGGGFTSRETAAFYGIAALANAHTPVVPIETNPYPYVLNNPNRYIDPDGRNTLVGAGWGFAIGGPPGAVVGAILGTGAGIAIYYMCKSDAPDCGKVKNECLDECSEEALPSGDHGFRFWNCMNACMKRNGC